MGKILPTMACRRDNFRLCYLAGARNFTFGLGYQGIVFGHPKAGVFKEEHDVLVSGIAAQASIALDNAKLYEDINALNSKKDEFIGFISHELRTPLTTLKGYLEISHDDPNLISEIQPRLSRQVTRLEEIISDLLDISKIEAGKLDFSFSRIGLGELVKKAVDSVNHTEHHVEFEMPTGKIAVMVDVQKMTQVLVNLISNALKYSPKGSAVKLEAGQFGGSHPLASGMRALALQNRILIGYSTNSIV